MSSERIAFAEKLFSEALDYMAKDDAAQASEKLYKAVEECIKVLAEKFNVSQVGEARKRKWLTWLLGEASTELAVKLNEPRISHVWAEAYAAHVWCFHEARCSIRRVEFVKPLAKWLIEYTKKVVGVG